jgi:hypothetical protein
MATIFHLKPNPIFQKRRIQLSVLYNSDFYNSNAIYDIWAHLYELVSLWMETVLVNCQLSNNRVPRASLLDCPLLCVYR